MKCNIKPYRLQRMDGLFLAQHPSNGWRFTRNVLDAIQLSQRDVNTIMHTYIPQNEWTMWSVLTVVGCFSVQ